ncbi:MAG: uracil-DNA glycosylase [Bacilli bacterium]|nr:uracil-DNA glycosylase [Bacilli bacterium]
MIGNDWDKVLEKEFQEEYFYNLLKFVQGEYERKTVFPPKKEVFKAFRYTPYKNVKVVILGQDPYHGEGEAEGLCFSVRDGIKKPPSLNNIFKELHDDLGYSIPTSGSLVPWAKQGVFLLNTVLTVIKDKAASHKDIGWERFTDEVIKKINEKEEPVVFILWGNFARSKKKFITNKKHLIIESAHPSPLSAYNGFFGSKPFSKANDFLIKNNLEPINFEIKEKTYEK